MINIYTNKNNELIASSLRELEKIDNVTYFAVGDNVIADVELPQLAENQAYKVSGNRNADGHYTVSANASVVADYRNVETYNTTTGELEKATEIGELPENLTDKSRPSEYHTWNGSKWTLTAAAKKQQLQDAKASKLAELNTTASQYIEAAAKISETPEFERATWTIQATEATAWHNDNTAPTPNLERIAASRGVPANVLRQKAYEKAMQFEVLTSTIAGQRQKIEDIIGASKTLEELKVIEFAFTVGDGNA